MRVHVTFKTKKLTFPLDYRKVFLLFLKTAISSINDGKYFEKYYAENQRRPFTFAVYFKNAKFTSEEIILDNDEINLTFSTGDSLTGFVFMSAFIAMKNKSIPLPDENSMTLQSVKTLKEREVTGNSILVKMLSPLCLREHDKSTNSDNYYSVKSDNFEAKVKEILITQLISEGFSKELAQNIEIVPTNCKPTVVKHYGCFIECSLGDFIITADKAINNYFLKYGIGSRKSAGFGFANLIAEI